MFPQAVRVLDSLFAKSAFSMHEFQEASDFDGEAQTQHEGCAMFPVACLHGMKALKNSFGQESGGVRCYFESCYQRIS